MYSWFIDTRLIDYENVDVKMQIFQQAPKFFGSNRFFALFEEWFSQSHEYISGLIVENSYKNSCFIFKSVGFGSSFKAFKNIKDILNLIRQWNVFFSRVYWNDPTSLYQNYLQFVYIKINWLWYIIYKPHMRSLISIEMVPVLDLISYQTILHLISDTKVVYSWANSVIYSTTLYNIISLCIVSLPIQQAVVRKAIFWHRRNTLQWISKTRATSITCKRYSLALCCTYIFLIL